MIENCDYEKQREWSDSYIPYVSQLIINGLHLNPNVWYILVTSFDQDTQEAADLILTDGKEEFMIALRLRNASYMDRYPFDFTVRREYTEGYKTEYEKIMEGFADMMFYGFRDGNNVVRWALLLMDEFRDQHEFVGGEWIPQDHIVFERRDNKDGRNCFNGYDINTFKNKDKLILACSDGYFDDVVVTKIPGLKTGVYKLKNKEDRIDGN